MQNFQTTTDDVHGYIRTVTYADEYIRVHSDAVTGAEQANLLTMCSSRGVYDTSLPDGEKMVKGLRTRR